MKRIFVPVLFLLFCRSTTAQQAVTNSGNLNIFTGASVFAFGNFTNNSLAVLTNNGNLYIQGDLSNSEASMNPGAGTLYLNGTTVQAVNGTEQFKTYKLQTNNSSGITLNNDLSVSNVHTFSAGIVTSSSTPNYLIYEAGSSYSGDGDSKHVNGWVKKIGSTNFTFPVGNATVERTIALNSLSASTEFNVNYGAPTPNRYSGQAPLLYIDPNEYWNITKVSGGSASVAMNWDNSKVTLPPWVDTDIRVASWDGANWVSKGGIASGNPATTGNITSNTVSSFSRFTFGGEALPLPLTLISFDAKHIDDHTILSWTTVDEQNVDHFTAERSEDGNYFYSVAQLAARNTGNKEFYSTIDNKPINHIAYYRLRCTDMDGKQTFSRIVPILVSDATNNLVLLTNPVHDHLTLVAGQNLNGSFNYNISMTTGQLMQKGKLVIHAGGQYQLPLKENFQKGVYTLIVKNGEQSFSYKFVVD